MQTIKVDCADKQAAQNLERLIGRLIIASKGDARARRILYELVDFVEDRQPAGGT